MTYQAYVCELKNVRPHPNADRLLLAMAMSNQVVVGSDSVEGQLGLYFPSDGRLSLDYCTANDLIRRKDEHTGMPAGGMFDTNRKVRTQKFRGERSDGYFAPLSSLSYLGRSNLKLGDAFTEVNGKMICEKFITESTQRIIKQQSRTSKKWSFPLFREHIETEQLQFYHEFIPDGSVIHISEKVHGTSGRTTFTRKEISPTWLDRIFSKFGYNREVWETVSGTRHTVLDIGMVDTYYNDTFRSGIHNKLDGLLYRGETIYYEIAGYTSDNSPIMNSQDTTKLKDVGFTERYGKQMIYSYSCQPGENHVFVYRITMTNADGKVVEYGWDRMVQRCTELGLDVVPTLDRFVYYKDGYNILDIAEKLSAGASIIDQRHIKEGVVLRIDNPKYEGGQSWLKYKSYEFKYLEGILKETGVADVEEAS